MFEIKTELRLQFHTITDMSSYIRTIVSPYTKVATDIKFTNSGRPSERAQINFLDENLVIVLDWDFLVVITIGKTTDLAKPEERFIHFFEIFEKVKKIETYNDLRNTELKTWDLLPDVYSNYSSFEETFLKKSKITDRLNPNDAALILEGYNDDNNIQYSCNFGPFDYVTDIEKHELNLFNKNAFEIPDSPKKGCLINTNIRSRGSTFDIDILAEFFIEKNEIIKTIQL